MTSGTHDSWKSFRAIDIIQLLVLLAGFVGFWVRVDARLGSIETDVAELKVWRGATTTSALQAAETRGRLLERTETLQRQLDRERP